MSKLSCIVYFMYFYVILIGNIDLIAGEIIDYSQQSEGKPRETLFFLVLMSKKVLEMN